MHSFNYGSRIIENEQQVRLECNVRRIGNLLHAVVRLFVTFFLFVLINILLSSLVQHVNLTFVKLLHLVQQSAEILFSQSALSAVTGFLYHQSFSLMLAVTFFCACLLELVILNLLCRTTQNVELEKEKHTHIRRVFNTEAGEVAVSYRQKVCFLS
ncbi:MAG: hypothetical protein J1F68_01720 [Clostridiales bacterium]|nr:hypothetical protein [Clostridiales bacterium]